MSTLLALLLAVGLQMGCSGSDGVDGRTLLVESDAASSEDCPQGGTTLSFGYDTQGDGFIDEVQSVQHICDGVDAQDGLTVLVETSPASASDCPAGGLRYTFGHDTTGDGEIDDVLETQNVCNGADLLVETETAHLEDCPYGGVHVRFGYDTNGNGNIDDIVASQNVCNGAPGNAGDDGLSMSMESEPAALEDCPHGGVRLTFGYDTDEDGSIDDVVSVENICNGEPGADAPVLLMESGAAVDCPAGGTVFTFGYDTDGDGSIDDVVETQEICNGADGNDGLTLLVETEEIDSPACQAQGVVYTFGYDTNEDGSIDDIASQVTICVAAMGDDIIIGTSVLYYVDTVLGADALQAGLEALEAEGLISLTVTGSESEATTMMNSGNYDVVFHFRQDNPSSASSADLLAAFVNNGGRLVYGSFAAPSTALLEALGVSYGGTNENTASIFDEILGQELPDPLALTGTGWITFSTGLTPVDNAVSLCSFPSGDSCAVAANERRSLTIGFLSDTFEVQYGRRFVTNALRVVLEAPNL